MTMIELIKNALSFKSKRDNFNKLESLMEKYSEVLLLEHLMEAHRISINSITSIINRGEYIEIVINKKHYINSGSYKYNDMTFDINVNDNVISIREV